MNLLDERINQYQSVGWTFGRSLGSAVQYGLLVKNPVEGIRLPAERRGKRKTKPHVTTEQFEQLLALIPEPYASMVFVAAWTGLRASELIGLKMGRRGSRLANHRRTLLPR